MKERMCILSGFLFIIGGRRLRTNPINGFLGEILEEIEKARKKAVEDLDSIINKLESKRIVPRQEKR